MHHIVKLDVTMMKDVSAWGDVIFMLDPSINASSVKAIELTVDTVFFEESS